MKKLILISALLLVASNGWADVMKWIRQSTPLSSLLRISGYVRQKYQAPDSAASKTVR